VLGKSLLDDWYSEDRRPPSRAVQFCSATARDRHNIFVTLDLLTSDWPRNFVRFFDAVDKPFVLQKVRNNEARMPYFLAKALSELVHGMYIPSDSEVDTALDYLLVRRGIPPKMSPLKSLTGFCPNSIANGLARFYTKCRVTTSSETDKASSAEVPFALSDGEYDLIRDIVPRSRVKDPLRMRHYSNRDVLNAFLYKKRARIRWNELPASYPPCKLVQARVCELSRGRLLRKILDILNAHWSLLGKPVVLCRSMRSRARRRTRGFELRPAA